MNKKLFGFLIALSFIFVPLTLTYAEPIVPVCNTGPIDQITGNYENPCNFTYFMILINNAIKFLLFTIATPFIALIIIYVAYLFLTSSGSSDRMTKAKHILASVLIGYAVALGAWLIVNTIVTSLGVDPTIDTFLKK